MKLILSLLILLTSSLAFGQVPSFKGQSDTTEIYPVNITTPNHQVTKTNSSTVLIETGNTNRLKNSGFEATPIGTGWTTGCTGTATLYMGGSSLKYEGKQVLEFEVIGGASGGQCTIYQNAETVAVDGVVAIAIHSENASGVKVLKKTNIYDIALEKEILGKSEWQKIELVGKLGSSETGVAIEVTVGASETKEVHLDEAKVAIANTKQVVGVDTDWKPYTPIITGLGAGSVTTLNGFWRRVGDTIDIQIAFQKDATAGTGATPVEFSLPDGLVADASKVAATMVGTMWETNAALSDIVPAISPGIHNTIRLVKGGATTTVVGSDIVANNIARFTISVPIVGWSATTEVYSIEADFFSTDTNTLTFKGTAITDSDPVGTFNTYSYAISSNTKTICGTVPAQSIADMKANGIQIFTRPFNAVSTCGNPARVEVKLAKAGTSLPSLQVQLYKNDASSVPRITGSLAPFHEIPMQYGAYVSHYDESTGIFILDTGWANSASTSRSFLYDDLTIATSGYLVINAQPKKTTAVADFKGFVKSQGATSEVDIQSFSFGGNGTCNTACTTGTCYLCNRSGDKVTSMQFISTGVYDVNGIDTTKYSCVATGVSATGSLSAYLSQRNTTKGRFEYWIASGLQNVWGTIQCIGQP